MDQEGASHTPEPVRSRWSPKPEQILILESIFNNGIVNPPKEETVRIRKMLEKFGAVGDANVFYWFQNRRSRSRRKQRQLQAATAAAGQDHQHMTSMHNHQQHGGGVSNIDLGYGSCSNSSSSANYFCNGSSSSQVSSSFYFDLSSSSSGGFENNNGNLFAIYGHESDHHHQHQLSSSAASTINPSDQTSISHYQQGLMMVFINGVRTEVTKGAIDTKAMFGEDLILLQSSGLPLPTDEFGFLLQSLQLGQSYFLVPRQT